MAGGISVSAGVTVAHSTGVVSGGDRTLRGDRACGGVGACSPESASDISGGWGVLEVDSVAGWLGDGGDEFEGSGFVVLAFFWPTPQHDCWRESLHCRSWPVSLAGEPAVATWSVAVVPAGMEKQDELGEMGRPQVVVIQAIASLVISSFSVDWVWRRGWE